MARIAVTRSWPDEDALQVVIEVDGEHPDALDMAAARALKLYGDALGVTLAADDD